MSNNILVTGATGYLGSEISKTLSEGGFRVIGVRRPGSSLEKLTSHLDRVVLVEADATPSVQGWKNILKENRVDVIVHTATCYGRRGESDLEVYACNVELPYLLISAAAELRLTAFVNTDTGLPAELNYYTKTKKIFCERMKEFSPQIKIINLLLEHFYGPQDGHFVSRIAQSFLEREPFLELTLGEQERDFIYIDDVVSAYVAILHELGKTGSGMGLDRQFNEFQVGSGKVISIRKLVELLQRLTHGSETQLQFGKKSYRENEPMHSVADISILGCLGWKPQTGIEEGLQQVLRSRR